MSDWLPKPWHIWEKNKKNPNRWCKASSMFYVSGKEDQEWRKRGVNTEEMQGAHFEERYGGGYNIRIGK